jgi:serine/threonine-protein kinase
VAIPLVVTGAVERMPTLSPDGRGFAYVSNTTGRPEVYMRPFPEVNSAVWQVSTAGASEPRWAHSGRELLFHTEARELAMWDVTPGDHRFLMLRSVPGEVPTELIVVENFFEELQAKVKR